MARQGRKNEVTQKPMSGMERLSLRVSSMINHPIAQERREAKIHRLDDDGDREWSEILSAMSEADGIVMEFDDDGAVTLKWEAQDEGDNIADAYELPEAEVEEAAPF